ncbi:MAG TPA: delta-60 repeat domain-containing protein [Verrucomicrobiales bacterium]|nr:delta-60 repeat domain-containing protein [Verrucomicrobiales bacterium]
MAPCSITTPSRHWPQRCLAGLLMIAGCHSLPAQVPGSLLPNGLPPLEAEGTATAAAVTADGKIVVAGDFWSLNGTPLPGLARLRTDGSPDTTLKSGVGTGGGTAFGLLGSSAVPALLPLSDGRFFLAAPQGFENTWTVLDSEGHERPQDFPELIRGGFDREVPQFESDGSLYLLEHSNPLRGPRLIRAAISTGEVDKSFVIDGVIGPAQGPMLYLAHAYPGADGGIWISGSLSSKLAGSDAIYPGSTGIVARHLADGTLDPAFPRQSFHSEGFFGSPHRFLPSPAGDLLRITMSVPGWNMWPGPTSTKIEIQPVREPMDGSSLVETSLPLTVPLSAMRGADGRLIANLTEPFDKLHRYEPDGTADESFQPIPAGGELLLLPDGSLLADGLKRYTANGAVAPGWTPPAFRRPARMREIVPGPGGTAFVLGDMAERQIVKLKADGTADADFQFTPSDGYSVSKISPVPDGRLFILESLGYGREARVVRLTPSGTRDAAFVPFTGSYQVDGGISFFTGKVSNLAARADGSVLVQLGTNWDAMYYRWIFVGENGSPLPGSLEGTVNASAEAFMQRDGRFWIGNSRFTADGKLQRTVPELGGWVKPLAELSDGRVVFASNGRLWAVTDAGLIDETYGTRLPWPVDNDAAAVAGESGKLYLGTESDELPNIVRLHRDGRIDPAFRGPVFTSEAVAPGLVSRVMTGDGIKAAAAAERRAAVTGLAFAGGRLWVCGDFTRVAGQRYDGLASVTGGMVTGYGAWAAACFANTPADRAREADADADGISNLMEYAQGSDPLRFDGQFSGLQIISRQPLSLSAPRNPDAPEVSATIEVSENGPAWRTATAAEVTLKYAGLDIAFEVAQGPSTRLFRIRYSGMAP